ncbi:hypothetical protein Nepgr_031754 [Nepenthes gracilis]|uniref:Uncharacterized protein n=1 Tax=Nepenthes gracilis TaxID=150966 RepID=A0AAD3Y7S5_NEPGR|nr:hypothetical protein Nepgr_031754 [Nepenthes gracilis]
MCYLEGCLNGGPNDGRLQLPTASCCGKLGLHLGVNSIVCCSTVEDAPTVGSSPSPHAVQCNLVPDDESACRIVSDVERLRKQLLELKDQRCLDLQLPCCTQAARESVPDVSPAGNEAAGQGMLVANASPSCHLGPHARWSDEELFARQATT